MTELGTERLVLRRWRESDRLAFRSLNADPQVMEFMPALLTPEESDAMVKRIGLCFEQRGFGLFAAELREEKVFIGFIGLSVPAFDACFMPAVEIGWRLAAKHWGRGLATEGAREVLRYGFETIGLNSIVSFTVRRTSARVG